MLSAVEWEEQQAAREAWESAQEVDEGAEGGDRFPSGPLIPRRSSENVVKPWVAGGSAGVVGSEEVAISESGRVTLVTADEEELRGGRWWQCLDYNIDWVGVRNIALPIITRFTFRTNGTCMTPRIPVSGRVSEWVIGDGG